jgi:hypothetical protein
MRIARWFPTGNVIWLHFHEADDCRHSSTAVKARRRSWRVRYRKGWPITRYPWLGALGWGYVPSPQRRKGARS